MCWATLNTRLSLVTLYSVTHSSTFDIQADITLNGHFVKLISRYDSKFGFIPQMVDLMVRMPFKKQETLDPQSYLEYIRKKLVNNNK